MPTWGCSLSEKDAFGGSHFCSPLPFGHLPSRSARREEQSQSPTWVAVHAPSQGLPEAPRPEKRRFRASPEASPPVAARVRVRVRGK